jgi:hypothetical protein
MNDRWQYRILCTLTEVEGPLRTKQIALRCGCVLADHYASVRHALRTLTRQGRIAHVGYGLYAALESSAVPTLPPLTWGDPPASAVPPRGRSASGLCQGPV